MGPRIWQLLALLVLTAASASARAEWHEARSKHFVIYSDGPAKELEAFATKLEKFDRAVRIARNMQDPPVGEGGRLTVYVLPTAQAVAAMAGDPKGNVAGFYIPRASGSIAFVHRERVDRSPMLDSFMRDRPAWQRFIYSNPETVFFHEYFHHLMLSEANAALPRWVVEGFAEYFSTAVFERDGSVTLGRPAAHRAAGLFAFNKLSLDEMLAGSNRKLDDKETEELYGRGWLLTHYLTNEPARSGQLQSYLKALQNGQSGSEAAKAAFGDLEILRGELERYLRSRNMGGFRVVASALQIDRVVVRPLTAAESAILPVRMKSDLGVNATTAPGVAADARKVAAQYPADPVVQGYLAEAELDAGNFPAAIAAADKALAVDPGNIQALVYKGRALMQQAAAAPEKADWNAVRGWFTRANKLDSENAEPLMLFYESYLAARSKPTANAVDALLYAVALAPQDQGLRLTAVRQLLIDERLDDARMMFAPIAFNPHNTDERRETGSKIMAAIAAGDSKTALGLLESKPRKNETAAGADGDKD